MVVTTYRNFRAAMPQLGDVNCAAVDVKPGGRGGAREIGLCTLKTKGATPQYGALKYPLVWQKVSGQRMLNTDISNMGK